MQLPESREDHHIPECKINGVVELTGLLSWQSQPQSLAPDTNRRSREIGRWRTTGSEMSLKHSLLCALVRMGKMTSERRLIHEQDGDMIGPQLSKTREGFVPWERKCRARM